MIANLIGALVIIIVAVSFIPTMSEQITNVQEERNITGLSANALRMIPIFYGMAIIAAAAIATAWIGLREGKHDLIGWTTEEGTEEEPTPKRTRKQSYKEYVQERMEVEEMMK